MSKRQSEDICEEYGFRRSTIEDVYDGWDHSEWYEQERRCSPREIYNRWCVMSPTQRERGLSLTVVPPRNLDMRFWEFIPALRAYCESCQTSKRLGNVGEEQRIRMSKGRCYTWYAVETSECKVKRQKPVDPFLSEVLDD